MKTSGSSASLWLKHPVISTVLWMIGSTEEENETEAIDPSNRLTWSDDHGASLAEFVNTIQSPALPEGVLAETPSSSEPSTNNSIDQGKHKQMPSRRKHKTTLIARTERQVTDTKKPTDDRMTNTSKSMKKGLKKMNVAQGSLASLGEYSMDTYSSGTTTSATTSNTLDTMDAVQTDDVDSTSDCSSTTKSPGTPHWDQFVSITPNTPAQYYSKQEKG